MTTATITGPLLADDGTPLAGRTVKASLIGGTHTAAGELVLPVTRTTDDTGNFSLTLTVNPDITPAGSFWEITAAGTTWRIVIPSAGTWHVGDTAIRTSGATTSEAEASIVYVDAQVEVVEDQVDTLQTQVAALQATVGALPAPVPGVFALAGFVDLAGQTRPMYRATAATSAQNPIVALQAGRIVGISVAATASRTAGSAVFTARIGGSDTALVATIDASNPRTVYAAGSATFAAGALLDVRHADSGFTPSTNFEATLWCVFT